MKEEDRKNLDDQLQSLNVIPKQEVLINGKRPPPWWKGGQKAVQSNVQAAQDLGFAVGSSKR